MSKFEELKVEYYDDQIIEYILIKNIYINNYVEDLLTFDFNIYFKDKLVYTNLYQILNLNLLLEFLLSSNYNKRSLFILNFSKYKEEKNTHEEKINKTLKIINDLFRHIDQILIIVNEVDLTGFMTPVEEKLNNHKLYKKYKLNSKIFYTFINKYI